VARWRIVIPPLDAPDLPLHGARSSNPELLHQHALKPPHRRDVHEAPSMLGSYWSRRPLREATLMEFKFTEPVLLKLESQRRSPAAVAKRDRLIDLLLPMPGERILDIGCGGGAFCREIAPRVAPGGSVIGIDHAPAAVDVATRLSVLDDRSALTFAEADGHDLPFVAASFDAAVCVSALGFCRRPEQVLAEARRVLRPGGRLLVVNSDEDTRVYNGRDRALGRRMARAIADRGNDPWLGRRIAPMLTAAGFRLEQEVVSVDLEREFSAGTSGYALAHSMRDHLLRTAGIPEEDYTRWLADLASSNQDGSYCYSVVTYACLATR
jgi:arsenite methyltransferase